MTKVINYSKVYIEIDYDILSDCIKKPSREEIEEAIMKQMNVELIIGDLQISLDLPIKFKQTNIHGSPNHENTKTYNIYMVESSTHTKPIIRKTKKSLGEIKMKWKLELVKYLNDKRQHDRIFDVMANGGIFKILRSVSDSEVDEVIAQGKKLYPAERGICHNSCYFEWYYYHNDYAGRVCPDTYMRIRDSNEYCDWKHRYIFGKGERV